MTHAELYDCRLAASRRRSGASGSAPASVSPRYMPNMPETIVAALGRPRVGRGLVVLLAGLRRPGGAGSVRPDRTPRARCRRRLLLRRETSRRPAAPRPTSSRDAAVGRADGHRPVRRDRRRTDRAIARSIVVVRVARERKRGGSSLSNVCPSIIRCTSSIPRARPAFPSASCTARAAR